MILKKGGIALLTTNKVNIRPFVVADMAFEHKYLKRSGGSGKPLFFACVAVVHVILDIRVIREDV